MITIRNLTVKRGRRIVVDDVTLDVAPGELVALVGPNGSGKSSLVAAITSDLPYGAGDIEICGNDVARVSRKELAKLRAVMTQNNPVSFGFTVREVISFGRSPWRGTSKEQFDTEAVDDAIEKLDLLSLADRPVQALSGGELARVAMARALAQDTQALILDEPTAALDLRHQVDLLALVKQRVNEGVAGLVVLHDLSLAGAYATRVAVLSKGRLIADGSPEQILTPELLNPVYGVGLAILHNPSTNLPVVVPVGAAPYK